MKIYDHILKRHNYETKIFNDVMAFHEKAKKLKKKFIT